MDKCFFLLIPDSDFLSESSISHEFLHSLCGIQRNITIYTIVSEWNTLRQVRNKIPQCLCLLLDIDNEDVPNSRKFLVNLPKVDCIVDFTGKLQGTIISEEMGIASSIISWKKQDINIHSINEVLKTHTGNAAVLISAQKDKEKPKNILQTAAKCVQTGRKWKEMVAAGVAAKKGQMKFQPGQRFSAATTPTPSPGSSTPTTPTISSPPLTLEETASLLPRRSPSPGSAESGSVKFMVMTSWLCCCLPCWCPFLQYNHSRTFKNQAQLRREWHIHLRKEFDKIFQNAEKELEKQMNAIDAKVNEQVELMRVTYEEDREEKLKQYEKVKEKNRDSSYKDEIFAKTAASREKHALRKMKWSDQDFQKAMHKVNQQFKGEREQQRKIHYQFVVKQEFIVLREANRKFKDLYEQ